MTATAPVTVTVKADTTNAVSQIGKVTQAVEQVAAALRSVGSPVKGFRTSEFWLVLLSTPTVLTLLSTVFHGDFTPHVQLAAVILAQVSSLVYAACRTHLKRPSTIAAALFDLRALLGLAITDGPAAVEAVQAAVPKKAAASKTAGHVESGLVLSVVLVVLIVLIFLRVFAIIH